jgi:dTDP-4-dehydrorhamnose reductase
MRVVLTGASGQLGSYVVGRLVAGGHEVSAWSGARGGERVGLALRPVDLADAAATERALSEVDPDAIIHAAALSSVEEVRRDPERGRAVNVEATARLAAWCARRGRRMVYTSTDLVFDGSRPWYREDDPARSPLTYGRTKHEAEPAVLAVPGALAARLSLLYGPSRSDQPSYLDRTIAGLRRGEPQTFFEDEYRTPLDLVTAADALVRLLESGATGLIHVAGRERLSRFELARRMAVTLGLDTALVRANRQRNAPTAEPRPADVSLDTARLAALLLNLDRPTAEAAVARMWGGDVA